MKSPLELGRKPYPLSLWVRLKTDAQRDAIFEWLFEEGISCHACQARCLERFGVKFSARALRSYCRDHRSAWKIRRAKEKADEEKGILPRGWRKKIREGLAQRKFEEIFEQLTDAQIIALERLELDRRKVGVMEAKAAVEEGPEPKPKLSAEQRVARIQDIFRT
jgi:hypothetical protein